MVEGVAANSVAADSGFQPGETIASINKIPVKHRGQAIEVLIDAGKQAQPIDVELANGEHRRWMPTIPLPRSARIHPTQIYDAITGILLASFLWTYYPFRRRDGEVAALLITIYPLARFLLEWIRIDEPGQLGTDLSISQWISLVLLIAAAGGWLVLRNRPRQVAFGA